MSEEIEEARHLREEDDDDDVLEDRQGEGEENENDDEEDEEEGLERGDDALPAERAVEERGIPDVPLSLKDSFEAVLQARSTQDCRAAVVDSADIRAFVNEVLWRVTERSGCGVPELVYNLRYATGTIGATASSIRIAHICRARDSKGVMRMRAHGRIVPIDLPHPRRELVLAITDVTRFADVCVDIVVKTSDPDWPTVYTNDATPDLLYDQLSAAVERLRAMEFPTGEEEVYPKV